MSLQEMSLDLSEVIFGSFIGGPPNYVGFGALLTTFLDSLS